MVLPIAVASGFVLALLVPLLRRLLGRFAIVAFVALPAALALLFASLAPGVVDGEPVRWSVEWVPQLDLALAFSLDGLSLLFALLITGIGAAVILYAERYLHGHPEIDRFHALALAFMASMLGLVLADNLLLRARVLGPDRRDLVPAHRLRAHHRHLAAARRSRRSS